MNLARDNLYCPTAAVWSPDNHHIAILAQLGACTNGDLGIVEPNVVALFNPQGTLERLLYPDTVTLGKDAPTTPHPTPVASTFPQIVPTYAQYFTMSWSPDGKWLALSYQTTFAHDQTSNADYGKIDFGVALLAADGTTGDKLSQQTQSGGDIWDLQTRQYIIYDCATGAKRLTLATKPLANRLQYVVLLLQPLLRWSPSGKQLLLLNAPFDSLTIWNVGL